MLAGSIGRPGNGIVYVMLSDHLTHERRFPRRREEIVSLLDSDQRAELATDPRGLEAAADDAYSRSLYGHGVATRVRLEHAAPQAAMPGESAIYLDVETIDALADEFVVIVGFAAATIPLALLLLRRSAAASW